MTMNRDQKRRLQQQLIERDGNKCHYCGITLEEAVSGFNDNGISIDHVIPKANGGTDDLENLLLACRRCNLLKRTNSYQEHRLSVETDAVILFLMGVQS